MFFFAKYVDFLPAQTLVESIAMRSRRRITSGQKLHLWKTFCKRRNVIVKGDVSGNWVSRSGQMVEIMRKSGSPLNPG